MDQILDEGMISKGSRTKTRGKRRGMERKLGDGRRGAEVRLWSKRQARGQDAGRRLETGFEE
jgi:hypothetical protein